jgi:hypothetical protein
MEELFSRLQELVTEDPPQDEEALGVITESKFPGLRICNVSPIFFCQ